MDSVRVLAAVICVLFIGYSNGASAGRRLLQWLVDDDGCRTPDQEVGACTAIHSCNPMIELLSKIGEIDDNTRNLLKQYTCGYDSNGVKVCCPDKPITILRSGGDRPNKNLLPAACGISNSQSRITNGKKTDLYEFPWQVALRYESKKTPPYHCGGSLINNRYVLTAAHCIKSSLKLTGLRIGEYDLNMDPDCITDKFSTRCAPKPIDFDVTEKDCVVHEQYTRTGVRNDIALIRLPTEVEFTDAVGPVCLPSKPVFVNRELRNLTVIGWGTTEIGFSSTTLLKVTVPYVNNAECTSLFRNQITLSEQQLCAGGKDGKDSCTGDSGGPIMYSVLDDAEIRWVQAGLVSFGTRTCGKENVPAVYTRLTSYMDWILDNIQP